MDKVGDYLKSVEDVEAKRFAPLGTPLLARLDGRAFHTFTKGLKRPYDERLSELMIYVTGQLVHELQARVGYTQSDEISLVWYYPADSCSGYPFGGRFQKLCSVLASCATAYFVKELGSRLPEKKEHFPMFDCRVWPASKADALATFKWREADARKNAISMAASASFPHKDLQSINSRERLKMLKAAGVDFEAMPNFFKYGSYVYRHEELAPLDAETLAKIPERHRPADNMYTRSVVKAGDIKRLDDLENAPEFLFSNAVPVFTK